MSNDYCTTANIKSVFGSDNVDAWADLNNNDQAGEIAAQIAWAISRASDDIDDYLRGTHYRVPLKTAAGTTPSTIRDLAAMRAGVLLYENRGAEELHSGEPIHRLTSASQKFDQIIAEILSGRRRLDAV